MGGFTSGEVLEKGGRNMCFICDRIQMIKDGNNPYFVKELETGYVVLGDFQHFRGYSLFLFKEHISELFQLDEEIKVTYLKEMTMVAEAVYNVFQPEKINYELLGNGDAHLCWHLFPRRQGDTPIPGPVWSIPKEDMYNQCKYPSRRDLEQMKLELASELDVLCGDLDAIK